MITDQLDEILDLERALSEVQQAVLNQVWWGYSMREVAQELGLTRRQAYRIWKSIQRQAQRLSQPSQHTKCAKRINRG
jgi:FixJ family two-component response regulator